MSLAAFALVDSTNHGDVVSPIRRPQAIFPPDIWGDFFLQYAEPTEVDDNMMQQVRILKEEVKKLFRTSINHSILQKLKFIDSVQRLGVSYHFEHEIEEALEEIHNYVSNNNIFIADGDLHSLALLFRLLRQQRYQISSDVFNKFKNEMGNFNETLAKDVQGLWGLYEAAYLRCHGDDILDEPLNFTYTHLKSLANQLSPSLSDQINHNLSIPLYKRDLRSKARYQIAVYEEDPSHNKILLTFAKVDFNSLQKMHQKEIGSMAKWDVSIIESLPQSMKVVFETVVEVCDEVESVTGESRKASFVMPCFKQAICELLQAYLVEAKWCHEGYVPTYDEYKDNGILTSTYPLQLTSFIGLGEYATKEVFDWIFSYPNIIKAVSVISRFLDDIGSHKFEHQRVHVATVVECCMKEHGISQEEAYEFIYKDVEDCWKVINEEYLKPNDIPKPVIDCAVNLARLIEVAYENRQDKYTNGNLFKDYVLSLLVDPVCIEKHE